jgi:pyruvate/2-oxoglutarate/acetoin dehydrogenase E1 component
VDVICSSVAKTGRLMIAHDEVSNGGLVAMLALGVYDRAYWTLDMPIAHVTSPATPVPAAASLEDAYMVDAKKIHQAMLAMARG